MTNEEREPQTAEEIVEKHGREILEEMAEDGNIAARACLEVADEREGRT